MIPNLRMIGIALVIAHALHWHSAHAFERNDDNPPQSLPQLLAAAREIDAYDPVRENQQTAVRLWSEVLRKQAAINSQLQHEVLYRRAVARRQLQDSLPALEDINKALSIDANNAKYLLLRGILHGTQKAYKESQQDIEAAMRIEPKYRKAFADYESIVFDAQSPRSRKAIAATSNPLPDMQDPVFRSAVDSFFAHNYQPALQKITLYLQCEPYHFRWAHPAYEICATGLLLSPKRNQEYGDESYRTAVLATRLDDSVRKQSTGLRMMSEIALKHKMPTIALYASEEMLRRGARKAHWYRFRATALTRLQRYSEALDAVNRMLRIDASSIEAIRARADIHLALANYGAAIKDFSTILEDDAKDLEALAANAYILASCPDDKHRDGRKALEIARQLDERTDHKNDGVLKVLACALAESGQFELAQKRIQQALEIARKESALSGNEVGVQRLELMSETFRMNKPWRNSPARDLGKTDDLASDWRHLEIMSSDQDLALRFIQNRLESECTQDLHGNNPVDDQAYLLFRRGKTRLWLGKLTLAE